MEVDQINSSAKNQEEEEVDSEVEEEQKSWEKSQFEITFSVDGIDAKIPDQAMVFICNPKTP